MDLQKTELIIMSSIVTTILNASKTNNLPEVKAALDSWMAQEKPDPPRDLRWPMVDFQEALTAALEERNVEVAEELIHRGCWINTGVFPCFFCCPIFASNNDTWDRRSYCSKW